MKAKNKNKISEKAGFTLVEVLVTLLIIGIMSSIGIVSLVSSRNLAKVRNAQIEVASTIKLAQSYALQGKNCGNTSSANYRFIIIDNDDYSIECQRSGSGSGSWSSVESYKLSGEVRFSPTSGSVTFNVPHASKGGLSTITFTLTGTPSKTINIGSSGLITIN